MLAYALRRAVAIVPTLFLIVTVVFFLLRLAPGGPFDAEQGLPREIKANLEAAYGLDRPLAVQYGRYLAGLLRGDLGPSLKMRDVQVSALIARGFPISATLGASAVLLALFAGIPLGVASALRRGKTADHLAMAFTSLGLALPSFVIAPFLVLVFAVRLRWFPAGGWQADASHLTLPALTLALPVIAYIARLTRGSLLEVLRADFIRTARSKGIPEAQVILRHALRPALLPVVSFLGPAVAAVVTGSLVVETVFGLPGTGRYLVDGAIDRDYPLVMGMVILYGALTLLANLAADLLYGWLDPRVRHG
ncbi:MAG TPA: ABC transporter permease subunit [Steroidobacteraceae bacterium]|nr:ABC transporter permease subunit [Steroidobacteraceae bacterium]